MIAKILRTFRNNILVGLLLIAPIYFTIFIVQLLFNWFTGLLLDFFPEPMWKTRYEAAYRVAALLGVLVLLFLIGLFVRNILGRRLYHLGDRVIARIPIVSKIYVWIRQTMEVLLSQRDTLFKEVVMFEYPRPGVYSLGFVTGQVPANVLALLKPTAQEGEHLSIFIPTTPNPTSGWFCVVPRAKTIPVNMTTGEAMKLIISGGAVYPGTEAGPERATLLEKIDRWITDETKGDRPR
jgi:uncharacterized membrane protein